MSLTERYVYAVTKHLPQSQREDVAKELRASIEDMASDRAKHGKPTEKTVKEVLQELGDPAVLAGKYGNKKRYLIGPKWYDTYIALLKQLLYIVPGIVAAVMLAVNFVNLEPGGSIIKVIIDSIGVGIAVAIQMTFWITATFVILERTGAMHPEELADFKDFNTNEPWTPEQLPFPPNKRQIGLIESASNAALIAIGIGWVALSPIVSSYNGHQLLNPELWNVWIPVLFVLAGLALVHKLFQVKIGNWTTPIVVTNVLLGIAGIVYVLALITNIQVINVDFLQSLPNTDYEEVAEGARWIVGITAGAFIATYVWEMIDSIRLNRQLKK